MLRGHAAATYAALASGPRTSRRTRREEGLGGMLIAKPISRAQGTTSTPSYTVLGCLEAVQHSIRPTATAEPQTHHACTSANSIDGGGTAEVQRGALLSNAGPIALTSARVGADALSCSRVGRQVRSLSTQCSPPGIYLLGLHLLRLARLATSSCLDPEKLCSMIILCTANSTITVDGSGVGLTQHVLSALMRLFVNAPYSHKRGLPLRTHPQCF